MRNVTKELYAKMTPSGFEGNMKAYIYPDKAVVEVFIPENFIFGLSNIQENIHHLALNGRVVYAYFKKVDGSYVYDAKDVSNDVDSSSMFSYKAREELGKFFDEMAKEGV